MRTRAEREDLRHRVEFHGHVPDVADAMAGAGLLLHCREDEPFAAAVLEAMAAGLPVVAPRSGGCAEAVRDGHTGLLYEPGNADDAAACVVQLLDDRGLAARLGAAGREQARELWTEAKYLERQRRALARLSAS